MAYYIRSYEGQDEWVSKKWLAHMNLGNDIYMSFFGATKAEAEEKARAWYEKEKKHYEKIYVSDKKPETVKVMGLNATTGQPINPDNWDSDWGNNSGWGEPSGAVVDNGRFIPANESRGHHFAGKIWMVNKSTNHKTRIDQSQLSEYEANGYVRGGPRS